MKKLLSISVIAALAALPMAANAAVGDVVSVADPVHSTASGITAGTEPKYALAVEAATDGTNVATASYVKGAYNAAMKAINKVSETASSAVHSVTAGTGNGTIAVDGTDVSVTGLGSAAYTASTAYATAAQGETADQAAADIGDMGDLTGTADTLVGAIEEVRTAVSNVDTGVMAVTEGATNGTISVDGTDVSVHGLGSAAYTASTAYATAAQGETADQAAADIGDMGDLTGTADTLVGAIEEVRAAALTSSDLDDYATHDGVEETLVNHTTIAGTVPTVTVWGSETTGTAAVTASITAATYTEPTAGGGEG